MDEERVRFVRPQRRHNYDHVADLMLINLSVDDKTDDTKKIDSEEASSGSVVKKLDDSAGDAGSASDSSTSAKKIMADYESNKEKVRKEREPAPFVDPRFASEDD